MMNGEKNILVERQTNQQRQVARDQTSQLEKLEYMTLMNRLIKRWMNGQMECCLTDNLKMDQ